VELALNLIWALLGTLGLVCWLSSARVSGQRRSTQLLALATVALILFPVISVTDDFWAAQNPAEADSCYRRHDLVAHQHSIIPQSAFSPPSIHDAQPPLALLSRLAIRKEHVPTPLNPLPSFFFSRPPPSA
jgi:hypothetical protein